MGKEKSEKEKGENRRGWKKKGERYPNPNFDTVRTWGHVILATLLHHRKKWEMVELIIGVFMFNGFTCELFIKLTWIQFISLDNMFLYYNFVQLFNHYDFAFSCWIHKKNGNFELIDLTIIHGDFLFILAWTTLGLNFTKT